MQCGKCDACELERIGCGCDGALDDGCFLCRPGHHKRPPCYVTDPVPERVPRPDDCPHCGHSMWMGRSAGCQCRIPAVAHTAIFEGTDIVVILERSGHSSITKGRRAEVRATIDRRVDLFHFIRNLRFHLICAEEALARLDGAAPPQCHEMAPWPWEGENDV